MKIIRRKALALFRGSRRSSRHRSRPPSRKPLPCRRRSTIPVTSRSRWCAICRPATSSRPISRAWNSRRQRLASTSALSRTAARMQPFRPTMVDQAIALGVNGIIIQHGLTEIDEGKPPSARWTPASRSWPSTSTSRIQPIPQIEQSDLSARQAGARTGDRRTTAPKMEGRLCLRTGHCTARPFVTSPGKRSRPPIPASSEG